MKKVFFVFIILIIFVINACAPVEIEVAIRL